METTSTGRVQVIPHRFSPFKIMRELRGMAEQFRAIPDHYWSPPPEDSGEDPRRIAIVNCPCGETPNVPIADLRECACGRFYTFLGKQVQVALGPVLDPS